jgi:hypothetical protein
MAVQASGKFITTDGGREFVHGLFVLNIGDTVRVLAYGYGATREDCGRTGTVIGFGRNRAHVDFGIDGTKSIGGGCLARIDA